MKTEKQHNTLLKIPAKLARELAAAARARGERVSAYKIKCMIAGHNAATARGGVNNDD